MRSVGVVRALRLRQLLQARPYTVRTLARRFGVSPRTIWRDLRVLEAAGCRLVCHDRPGRDATYQIVT